MKNTLFSKFGALFLALTLVIGIFSFTALADENSADAYVITCEKDLADFANMVNNGKNANAEAILEDDIAIESSWTPLGKNAMSPFKGVFDGNGHSITVTVDDPDLSYFGFFGCLDNATVKNLTVNGEIYCSEPYTYVGGLSGRARGNVTVENCTVNAGVSSLARSSAGVGGFIGGYDDGIDYVSESVCLKFKDCVNNGFVIVTGDDASVYVGGFVGTNQNCVQLENCISNAMIYAPGVCVGGLLGQAGSTAGDLHTTIGNCTSNGVLCGADGKVGRLWSKGVVSNDYLINSGTNDYTSIDEINSNLLLETKKYPSVIAVSSTAKIGDYVKLIKSDEAVDDGISVTCSMGEKDISFGYIECDEIGARLAKINESEKVVQETATLQFTDANSLTVRKSITFNIYPGAEDAKKALMNAIAETYNGKSDEWVVFDMAVYETLGFGENTVNKKNYLNKAVNCLEGNVPLATDRAKAEIIFASLGIDSAKLTAYNGEAEFSNAEKLAGMDYGTSVYTAPWILIAEEAGRLELSDEIRDKMISVILENQGENGLLYYMWSGAAFDDIDTTGTALSALARFYDSKEDAKNFIDKALIGLSGAQADNGSYGNVNTDAMAIIGLAAMGIDPATDERFIKNGCSLGDAVMLYVNESKNGFTTPYASGPSGDGMRALATEQGFRALITMEQIKKCTAFNVYSQKSTGISESEEERVFKPYAADGTGTEEEGEGSEGGSSSSNKTTAKLTIKTNNETWLKKDVEIKNGVTTVADMIEDAIKGTDISVDGLKNGYIKSVTKGDVTLGQFDKGDNSGWLYNVNDVSPMVGISDYKLNTGDKVKLYYTIDYTEDPSSSKWHGSSSSSVKKNDTVKEEKKNVDTFKIPFEDVSEGDWFYEYLAYAYKNNLISGVSENEFSPEEMLSRSMFVTILYRIENSPKVDLTGTYADVKDGEWYTKAVYWALKNDIVNGLEENMFGPDELITREQLATMILRYAFYKGYDVSSAEGDINEKYKDAELIADYAKSAMKYAVSSSIISGKTETTLNPADTATRAETVTIIVRFLKTQEK